MYNIEYCGYNIHNPNGDIIYRPKGSASYLFLLILAPMNFEINGEVILAKAGACILYTPGFAQRYQAVDEFYNSYLHFFSELKINDQFSIPLNTIFHPEGIDDINWYIKNIHKEFLTKQLHCEKQIDAFLRQLLIHLDRNCLKSVQETPVNSSLFPEFQSLRLQMLSYCEEDWSIERLCQLVNLEKSQVYAYYHKFFHTTPKTELINARIDKAKYLLMNEALQIGQIAQMSGFHDIYHFSRCFKKNCGCSPSKFGKERL
ncbi:MAG: AraC family transcriptional regulator [Herbinix sp.]|jgi:AraC-like DNA-binding protein|nr:AraC family transcriptional regulator [Herbinix sp.]